MQLRLTRPLGIAAVTLAATAGILTTGAAAQAAPAAGTLGTLTNNPATGSDLLAPKVHTSAGCSSDSDAYNAVLTGPGAFASGYTITPTQSPSFSTTEGFDVQLGSSFKDAAADLGTTIVAGEYDLTVNCVDSFLGDVKGTFTGAFYFTSPTAYQSTDPNAGVTTTTTLAVTPASPADAGSEVTLTATVTPASAAGTVQFKDGATNLGSAVAVTGGTAVLKTTALAAGTHSLTAVFAATSANTSGSTSAAVSYVVKAGQAAATTTALSVTPAGPVQEKTAVTLNATVAPAAAGGAVQFTDGGANLGSPVALSGGSASLTTSALKAGNHSFTAKFVPADAGAYAASESAAVALSITPFTGAAGTETISTTVEPGALAVSIDSTAPVVLPAPALAPDASKLTTGGSLNAVTVTDTRAGNLGWNVAGQVSDFSDGASHSINGANLGWSPKVVDKASSQTITAGPAVSPANAIAPGATAPAGVGLASSRTLASAAAGAGVGTAHLNADVSLQVPTTTVAGTYTATLTLTAI